MAKDDTETPQSGWELEQQGLDGETATGQTALDGGISKGETDE